MTLRTEWEGRTVGEWARLWGAPVLEIHQSIASTNDRALELAAEGTPAFTTVMADEQTQGRGRGSNRWHAPAGSGLLVSVVLPHTSALSPALPLVVGIAAARGIEAEAPHLRLRLKWPNDLYAGEAKVGGILCEARGGPVVAGVGLNIRTPQGGYPQELRAVSLESLAPSGVPPSTGAVATALMAELHVLLRHPMTAFPPHLRADFAGRDLLDGRRVITHLGEGTAAGVDENGALVLRRPDATEVRVLSGSVELA